MPKQRSNISTLGSIGIPNPIGLVRAPSLATRNIGILNPIGLARAPSLATRNIGILNPTGLARALSLATRNIGILNPTGLPGALKPDGINLETFSKPKDKKHNHNFSRSIYERCSQCRRRAYALACVGDANQLNRYQAWAMPFLTMLDRDIRLQNERFSTVMSRMGRYLRSFFFYFRMQALVGHMSFSTSSKPEQ